MHEIILALVKDMSVPTMLVLVAIIAGPAWLVMWLVLRQKNKFEHQESMVRIETAHRETMTKISRDTPKLADGRSVAVIDNDDDRS